MLDIKDLKLTFLNQTQFEVIHDLNLSIKEGEIVGIVGESGSGKTTVALAVAGLLDRRKILANGSISFDGKNGFTIDAKIPLSWEWSA